MAHLRLQRWSLVCTLKLQWSLGDSTQQLHESEGEKEVCLSITFPTGILPADPGPQTCYINYSSPPLYRPYWLCRKRKTHRHKQKVRVLGPSLGARVSDSEPHLHSLLCETHTSKELLFIRTKIKRCTDCSQLCNWGDASKKQKSSSSFLLSPAWVKDTW